MNWRSIALILLGLFFYSIPWLINPGVGLTANAYDLAEWASLHPEVRNQTPELLTSLLLRLPLVIFACLIALNTGQSRRQRVTMLVFFLLITLASFPPLEFLTVARNDQNYQQQFLLFLGALILGFVGLAGVLRRWHWIGIVVLAIVGVVASVAGLMQARHLMIGFSMPVAVGLGGIGTSILFLLIALDGFNRKGSP